MVDLFNILWFIFFGWWNALGLLFLSVLFSITIVGIPIGKSLFQLAKLTAFPYGKEVIRETELKGKHNVSSIRRLGGLIVNIIWLPIGIVLAIVYLAMGILAAITIIGIPVAIVYVKLGQFLLFPIGAKVVTKRQAMASAVANEMYRR